MRGIVRLLVHIEFMMQTTKMTSEGWRPLLVCGAVVYIGLCKVVYNGLLATEEELFSDSVIAKTLVLALVSVCVAYYVLNYYKKIKIPGYGAPVQPPPSITPNAPVVTTTSSRRISSLVPAQSSAFVSSH